jgi:hypothetical protein
MSTLKACVDEAAIDARTLKGNRPLRAENIFEILSQARVANLMRGLFTAEGACP